MAIQNLYPATRPTLALDFANTKTLDPRITFTRASEGRFYDGRTFAKAEENLLLQSQTLATAPWAVTNAAVTADTTAAPDGTTTADTVNDNATAGSHYLRQLFSFQSGATYAVSIFAKANTANFFQIIVDNGTVLAERANFDLSTGALGTVGAGITASITGAGGGWYRCTAVFTSGATVSASVGFGLITSGTSVRLESYTGTGTGIYLWGAQLEQRSAVTAYTPTTTAPITNYIPVLQTAAANVARFDHNPVTGESLGLLVEEQRSNLILQSEDFSTTWTATRSTVATNQVVAPSGALTGDKLVENTDNNSHFVGQTATIAASSVNTFSMYLKAAERSLVRMTVISATSVFEQYSCRFDLAAKTATTSSSGGGSVTSAQIQDVGNGWLRCSLTGQIGSKTDAVCRVFLLQSTAGDSYTGDGFSGIYIWGAQLESGQFPTSYIPTVASQVTRQADAASMTGVNFSSWYRQDEGTLYADHQKFGTANFQRVFTFSDGGFSNRINIGYASGSPNALRPQVSVAGTDQVTITDVASSAINTQYRNAFAYRTNDFASSVNGASAGTDTSGTLPTVDRAFIGVGDNGVSNPLNGHIRRLAYYPARLTNTQLQAITT